MSLKDDIYNYLMADTDFTSLVDSLGWVSVEETSAYPRVTFNVIDAPRIYQASDEWQRWRFYIVASNKFDIESISSVLTDLLNGLYGTVGSSTVDFIQKLTESEVQMREDLIYESYIDFRILYH